MTSSAKVDGVVTHSVPVKREGGRRVRGGVEYKTYSVSVITVVFNGAGTIEETIKSVVAQTCSNVEYIIVDGASTDATLEILEKYEDQIAYWVSEKDRGIYDAMNKGIALATADIIGILNADDTYTPDAVGLALDALQDSPEAGYCYGWLSLCDLKGRALGIVKPVPPSMFSSRVLRETVVPHPTVFMRRSVYQRLGAFDAKLRLAGDFELLARLHYAGVVGGEIPRVMAHFSIGGASSNPLILRERREVAVAYGASPGLAWFDWAVARLAMAVKRVLPPRAAGLMRQLKQRFLFRTL